MAVSSYEHTEKTCLNCIPFSLLCSQGKSAEVFDAKNKSLEAVGGTIKSEGAEVKGIMETIVGLSKVRCGLSQKPPYHQFTCNPQNIQTTSDKAFRSGDAKTIAVLVESHHKSLQLMSTSCAQLEAIAMAAEARKKDLTHHIHARLKLVMQLQKKVADSNGQLVLLHEHIKLARKRFEILEQVCSTPLVLGEVFNEVCRRRSYNSTLEKVFSYNCLLCCHCRCCCCLGDGRDSDSPAKSKRGGEAAPEVLSFQPRSSLCHHPLSRTPGSSPRYNCKIEWNPHPEF